MQPIRGQIDQSERTDRNHLGQDPVDASVLREAIREKVESDGVVLYG